LYTSGYGTFEPRTQRDFTSSFFFPDLHPLSSHFQIAKDRPSLVDGIASAFCFLGPAYIVWNAERLNFRMVGLDTVLPIEVFLGAVLVVLVVEGARRPSHDGWRSPLLCHLLSGHMPLLARPVEIQGILLRPDGGSLVSGWG